MGTRTFLAIDLDAAILDRLAAALPSLDDGDPRSTGSSVLTRTSR